MTKLFERDPASRPSAAAILAFPVVVEHIKESRHRMSKHKSLGRRSKKATALSTAHALLSAIPSPGDIGPNGASHSVSSIDPGSVGPEGANTNELPKARKQRIKSQRAAEKKANKEAKIAAKKERKATKRR